MWGLLKAGKVLAFLSFACTPEEEENKIKYKYQGIFAPKVVIESFSCFSAFLSSLLWNCAYWSYLQQPAWRRQQPKTFENVWDERRGNRRRLHWLFPGKCDIFAKHWYSKSFSREKPEFPFGNAAVTLHGSRCWVDSCAFSSWPGFPGWTSVSSSEWLCLFIELYW